MKPEHQALAAQLREIAETIREEAERKIAALVGAAELLENGAPPHEVFTRPILPPKPKTDDPSVVDVVRHVLSECLPGPYKVSELKARALELLEAVAGDDDPMASASIDKFRRGFCTAKNVLLKKGEITLEPGDCVRRTEKMPETRLAYFTPKPPATIETHFEEPGPNHPL